MGLKHQEDTDIFKDRNHSLTLIRTSLLTSMSFTPQKGDQINLATSKNGLKIRAIIDSEDDNDNWVATILRRGSNLPQDRIKRQAELVFIDENDLIKGKKITFRESKIISISRE